MVDNLNSLDNNNNLFQLAQVKMQLEHKDIKRITIIILDLKLLLLVILALVKLPFQMLFLQLLEVLLKTKRVVSYTSRRLSTSMTLISTKSFTSTCQEKKDTINMFTNMLMEALLSFTYLTSQNAQLLKESNNGSRSAKEHVKYQLRSQSVTKWMSSKQLEQMLKENQRKQLNKLQTQLQNQKLLIQQESMEWSTSKHAVLEKRVLFKFLIIFSIHCWL